MNVTLQSFEGARQAIPKQLLAESGKVFYSGRAAFAGDALLYILGVNPGGDPGSMQHETISVHTQWVSSVAPADWSAYRDERWKGKAPGTHGMQPRILHMLNVIGMRPGTVPASNLIFVRSRREGDIAHDVDSLADLCWPFHRFAIETLRPKVILCLGKTAGDYVRRRLAAHERCATFTEENNRRWQSHVFRGAAGAQVIIATHPSIADWTTRETDPSPLVLSALHAA
jgi:uracil-DNA glycosylase family 4